MFKADSHSACSICRMETRVRTTSVDHILSCESLAWSYCVSGAICQFAILGKRIWPQSVRVAATCSALACENAAYFRGNQPIVALFYKEIKMAVANHPLAVVDVGWNIWLAITRPHLSHVDKMF